MKAKKKHALLFNFTIIFAVFALILLTLCGLVTYYTQNHIYHDRYQTELENITTYLAGEIAEDGETFSQLVAYFKENKDKMLIPYEYTSYKDTFRMDFEEAFGAAYPGKRYGKDVTFQELDEDLQLLYARYEYLEWLTAFDRARDQHGLDYVYFVYPVGDDITVCYMFDGPKEVEVIDGAEYLALGIEADEQPEIHWYFWQTWNTGKVAKDMDVTDNEFGHVYTYSAPVYCDGELLGVLSADISVGFVRGLVIASLQKLILALAGVILISVLGMLYFIDRAVLQRVSGLVGRVREYAEYKDADLARKLREEGYYLDEIGTLSTEFGNMIEELKNYMDNLQQVTAERERIGAELNVATEIQAGMLPRIFPAFPDRKEFDLYASMTPAKEVGGDFYDFFFVDDEHLAVLMADVSGKGVPAALFMAISKALIKDRTQEEKDPAKALIKVNNQLCEDNSEEMFVTVWLGILNINTGHLIYSDAGHEYPVLKRADGTVELVKAKKKKMPVATISGIQYENNEIRLAVGDQLFLYTDGVPEANNSRANLYGMDRLMALFRRLPDMPPKELLGEVRKDVDKFVGNESQFDDLTMLALQVREIKDASENAE